MQPYLSSSPTLQWDIFCRVIDNHGDLGVCWRLCADLAQRGHAVRLWVDDASALAWMTPQGCVGVEVRAWPDDATLQALRQSAALQVGDVVIEAFGCELPQAFQALLAQGPAPVWINLEYLSAEGYVAQSHGLPSPVMSGPARGLTKWFFFPGFTPETGGLLRELDLLEAPVLRGNVPAAQSNARTEPGNVPAVQSNAPNRPHEVPITSLKRTTRQSQFNRAAWLKTLPLDRPIDLSVDSPLSPSITQGERLISLFCYAPAALPDLLQQLSEADQPTRLLVTPGRASAAVAAATQALHMRRSGAGALHISQLPHLSQADFDHLLWACDLNLVRGEDSLVRALWAGQPLVWHIYPQHDLAHHDKLHAFEATLDLPADLRRFQAIWNGLETEALPALSTATLQRWCDWSQQARQYLLNQTDLTTQLLRFAAQKR